MTRCKGLCSWRLVGAAAVGLFAFSFTVYGGPRPAGDPGPHGVTESKLVGVSRISELPPLPAGFRGTVEGQPLNVPVPIYEVHAGVAQTGAAKAIVYRQDNDSGYGNFNKGSAAGNFVGNLIHLGNGFPQGGGTISAYDVYVYNSVSNPETYPSGLIVHSSLYSGDPLGFLDTRTGVGLIAGSQCTFPGLEEMGGHGSNGCVGGYCDGGFLDGDPCSVDSDCGLCPAMGAGDDIPYCPGLYKLVCNMDPKVTIPSNDLWMILEYEGGCRMGWRWSIYWQPSIGASGEWNPCGTCAGAPGPCADLAIEVVDAASQYSQIGVGTCCENGNPCDHSDADTTNDCGHGTSCSDGVADTFSAWCFGAPTYSASFVSSVYANTDTYFALMPTEAKTKGGAPYPHTISGGEIIMENAEDQDVNFDVMIAGWDQGAGLAIKVWQAQIEPNTWASGAGTPLIGGDTVACTADADCGKVGRPCVGGYCAPAWQNCGPTTKPDPNVCLDLPACDISTAAYRCGSTAIFNPPLPDPGAPAYAMSISLQVPFGAKGSYGVSFQPDPNTFLKDQNSAGIPLVGYVPGIVTISTGQCCDLDVPYPFVCLADDVTAKECAAIGGDIFDPAKDCADACGCSLDEHCDDSDACTDDTCNPDGTCSNALNFDTATECCDVGSGATCTFDTGDPCLLGKCSEADNRGTCIANDAPDGTACTDGDDCTVWDQCTAGVCGGTNLLDIPCTSDDDCKGFQCDADAGNCVCVPRHMRFWIHGSDKPVDMCFAKDEEVIVDVGFSAVPETVVGGQFTVYYDTACLTFVDIAGVFPFDFELDVDVQDGAVFYATGVNPFGGVGVAGEAVMAQMKFTKASGCTNCVLTLGGDNPQNVELSDDTGQPIPVEQLLPSAEVHENDKLTLVVPDNMKVNTDCDAATAMVAWDWPFADSSCFDPDCDPQQADKCYSANLDCWGSHESGYQYPMDVVMKGGEMPQGISTFNCVATSKICGDQIADGWTVEVNDVQSLDVTIQLSPILAGDLVRCIKFELFSDCVSPPLIWEEDIVFGGLWDHVGHFTDVIKIPKGQFACITARDQLHTLRGCAFPDCVDGVYEAIFKGDPYFGGNWLQNGNLDGWKKENPNASHDVIDILDFGQFVSQYLRLEDPNTPCKTPGPHADINGDGIVDALDFSFVSNNFLAMSKDCCCPDSAAGNSTATTDISTNRLRELGMGDLVVGDLDRNGRLNVNDMAAFMAGAEPQQERKAPAREDRSGLGQR